MNTALVLATAALLCAGCAGDGGSDGGGSSGGGSSGGADAGGGSAVGPTWHADVKPIIDARCVDCHREGGLGPFSFEDYASAAAVKGLIAAEVSAGTMPPWYADTSVRAYKHDPSLTAAQRATIADWAAAGAPEGDPAEAGEPVAKVGLALPRVDLTLSMPEPYVPKLQPDDYHCFVIDWPATEETFVTGFDVKPGNLAIAHHTAVYIVPPTTEIGINPIPIITGLDAAEEGPGYTCYGGPNGDSGAPMPIQQMGQWVPGATALVFPEGTGIRMIPGSKIVLQMHYFVPASRKGEADTTELQVMTADSVDRPGAFGPWLNPSWVGSDAMTIPAGQAFVEHSHRGDPLPFFPNFIGGLDISNGFEIHSALLHIHQLGLGGEVRVHHKDGSVDTVLSMPTYDFNWQRVYELTEPIVFEPGDELEVICRWDNSEANQPIIDGKKKKTKDVGWGEGTQDEMCVGNLYISERGG